MNLAILIGQSRSIMAARFGPRRSKRHQAPVCSVTEALPLTSWIARSN